MGKYTYISLEFLFFLEEKTFVWRIKIIFTKHGRSSFSRRIFFIYKRLKMDIITCRYQKENLICSKLTTKTPRQGKWCFSGIFIVHFEQILHPRLFFLLLRQVNVRCGLLLSRHFSCVSYMYLHIKQNHLASHTKIDDTGGGGGGSGGEGWRAITRSIYDFILWFSPVLVEELKLDRYDFISRFY